MKLRALWGGWLCILAIAIPNPCRRAIAAEQPNVILIVCDDLNDYVEGDVDPSICDEFEEHLAGCNPCQVVVDNIRNTIALYKSGQPYPMPKAFHDSLRANLRARWREKFNR